MNVLRIEVSPGVPVDSDLLSRTVAAAAARRGWRVGDPDDAPDAILRLALTRDALPEADVPVLRIDTDRVAAAPDEGAPGAVVIAGHGLDTLPVALDALLAGGDADRREAYGVDPEQYLDWYEPEGAARAVFVLVHGGFYRSRWRADLMNGLGLDLARRGIRAANLEYRRPDRHGWAATVSVIAAGVRAARAAAADLPLVLVGHSAGGQLVLQAVEDAVAAGEPIALAVSLAGVVDLRAAHDRSMGEAAVALALGGSPDALPREYAAASPWEFSSRRGRWLLVQGVDDSRDLWEMNRRLAGRADLGSPELLEVPGDHFAVIDPAAPAWSRTVARIEEILGIAPLADAETAALDAADPAPERDAFTLPIHHGRPVAYLAANALGPLSHDARAAVERELQTWQHAAHGGHHHGDPPWGLLADELREPMGRIVGALPSETLAANGLSVNLHLLMASFYRPSGRRTRVLMEANAFPSDLFAVRSHVAWHGLGADAVLELAPRPGERVLRTADVIAAIERHGEELALIMLGGVNFLTGELLDIPAITAAAHAQGIVVGWDLAHAVGNVELALHDWGVDWAAWCSYKYLNGGPGATAGLFVHERHHGDAAPPRLAGWYGQRLENRFGDHHEIVASPDAEAWQISNPAILALAPVVASARMFDRHGMAALAARGRRLAAFLEARLAPLVASGRIEQLTPRDPARRGAQLSYRVPGRSSAEIAAELEQAYGVVSDARTPDVVRLAPGALWSSYADCARAADALTRIVTA